MRKASIFLINIVMVATLLAGVGCGDAADQRSSRSESKPGQAGGNRNSATSNKNPAGILVQPSGAASNGPRVLAILGGYLSCGQNSEAPFDGTSMVKYHGAITKKLAAVGEAAPPYIMSCFTFDRTKVTYVTSDTPNRPEEVPFDQFLNKFRSFTGRTSNANLYMMGHSYGGWLSMRLAKELPPVTQLAALVTLDPISRELCTPSAMAPAVFNDQPAADCTRSPADFGPPDLSLIAQRSRSWLNIYQTDAKYLHSGVIQHATNVKQPYQAQGLDPHSRIFEDPAVMEQVLKVMVP